MIDRLDESVPRDIRAALEGTTHGWVRLRRFQIHMAFPSLTTSSASPTAPGPVKQLEAAVGAGWSTG